MCLITFAWNARAAYPLVVAANRDEFYDRPSAPAAFWDDAPQVLGGRDLQAGGTWLGISRTGRFAAITNVRDPDGKGSALRSRGELTADFLRSEEPPEAYLERVTARLGEYQGFNLLVGDLRELWYLHGVAGGAPVRLKPGIYGLSNAALDIPWPKVLRAKARLAYLLEAGKPPSHTALTTCISDRSLAEMEHLPGHGLDVEMARRLSAQFIVTPSYGTRCQSTLYRHSDGKQHFCEARMDAGGHCSAREEFAVAADV